MQEVIKREINKLYYYVGPKGGIRLYINNGAGLYEYVKMQKDIPDDVIDSMKLVTEFTIDD